MATVLILSAPKCAGGTVLARIPDFASCTWSQVIGGDRGTCQLVLPADSTAVSKAAIFNVIRITDDDGSVYEYRITGLTDGPHLETVVVQAVDLSHDLGRVQLAPVVGGLPSFVGAPGALTATQVINNYVLPALVAAGITWVTIGTITPTALYTLTWNRSTPLAVMASLEAATKYEFWLSNNGDANYQINLGRRTTAGTPVAWVGRNVETLQRDIIVDEKFYTRATPYGALLSGETEATHIGQHGWKISTVAGNNLTLANPNGGTTPIGADSQLNNLVAGVSFDLVAPYGSDAGGGQAAAVAYDPTRRTIAWIAYDPQVAGRSFFWYCLADSTQGRVVIGSETSPRDVVYDSVNDQFLVACPVAQKLEKISASTKLSTGNVNMVGFDPSTLTSLVPYGKNYVAIGSAGGFVFGVKLLDLAPLTIAATLSTSTSANQRCLYDSGSTRYFCYSPIYTSIEYYSAAFASLGTAATGFTGGVAQAGLSGGIFYAIEYNGNFKVRPLTCSTATFGTAVQPGAFDGATQKPSATAGNCWGNGGVAPVLGSYLYVVTEQAGGTNAWAYILALDTTASFAIAGGSSAPGDVSCYDTTDDCWLSCSRGDVSYLTGVMYRNGLVAPSGRLKFVVGSTAQATQVVTKPGGTKGPLYAGQVAEFRADTSDTYNLALKDPAAFATYGPVDGYPALMDTYKRNYKRDPQLAEWASGKPSWIGVRIPVLAATQFPSAGALQWVRTDAQPTAQTTTGAIDTNQTLVAGIVSLKIKGLAAGRVIQPGDYLYHATSPFWVIARAVADGVGKATVSAVAVVSTTWNDGTAVTICSPAQSDCASANMLVLPMFWTSSTALFPPAISGGVHLPRITNATQAWLRLRFFSMQVNRAPASALSVTFSGAKANTVITGSGATGGTVSAPFFQDLVLEQQYTLSGSTGDFLKFIQAPDGLMTTTAFTVLYVKAVEAYVATAASCPSPFGATPGDELAPWIAANDLLFNQSRSNPTINYAVQFLEDGVVAKVGQTVMLRDPARGIAAMPRVMSVQRTIRRDANELARPIVQLSTRPLSAMEFLAKVGG
jgi:hypothetical protein